MFGFLKDIGNSNIKIEDTVTAKRSKVHRYWDAKGFRDFYTNFRGGLALPKNIAQNSESPLKIQEVFKLKGFQFGNWVSNEDRFNYLAAIYICLYDLNKVLKFKGANLGMDKNLVISFGARGSANALAHYEPATDIINITRYKRMDLINRQRYRMGQKPIKMTKLERFVHTGGVGSFAHEYGHYLDFYFGTHYDVNPKSRSLTGGRSTDTNRIKWPKTSKLRNLAEDIMQKIMWQDEKKRIPSTYWKRFLVGKKGQKKKPHPYYASRVELFARAFEQYIGFKLKEIGIQNKFLHKLKYTRSVYIPAAHFKKVVPLFDKLIREMRLYF